MEEQRHRQEEETRRVQSESVQGMETDAGGTVYIIVGHCLGGDCGF